MFVELNNILNCNEKTPPKGQTILVTETAAEGSFMIHHLISLYLKGELNVCLVGFAQSFSHYNNVATKLGNNLKTAKESGKFIFVEGLKILGDDLCYGSGSCTDQQTSNDLHAMQNRLFAPEKNKCKVLYEIIECSYKSLKNWQTEPCLLLIDDLSILVHLGIPSLDVVWLVGYLQALTVGTAESKGCLANFVHRDKETEDEDINFLVKNLQHKSDLHLLVEGLPTGYSKEVHGQMLFRWANVEQHEPSVTEVRTAQYKISDKNVHCFAKGMSSAVL